MSDPFDADTFRRFVGPEVRWRQDEGWRVTDDLSHAVEMERFRTAAGVERIRLTLDATGRVLVTVVVSPPRRPWWAVWRRP